MPLFTPELGQELARKRWKVCPTHSKPELPEDMALAGNQAIQDEITRTREQMEKLNDLIDSCTDPREQDALTRAKDRQFRIWARLAQLPTDPKPVVVRTKSTAQPLPMPTPIQPSPSSGPSSSSTQGPA